MHAKLRSSKATRRRYGFEHMWKDGTFWPPLSMYSCAFSTLWTADVLARVIARIWRRGRLLAFTGYGELVSDSNHRQQDTSDDS